MTEEQVKAYEKEWDEMTKNSLSNLSAVICNSYLPDVVRSVAAKELLSMKAFVVKHQPSDWHFTINGINDKIGADKVKFLLGRV